MNDYFEYSKRQACVYRRSGDVEEDPGVVDRVSRVTP